MFRTAEKDSLNQISLTGIRSIVLLGLLIVKPRSLEEIREAFIDLNIMEADNSDDILRIDLNTIKHMGCDISRASQRTDYKYVLGKHPFALQLSKKEVAVLKKAYNNVKTSAGLAKLLEYDELFKKIAHHIFDEEVKEALLGISVLKYYDVQFIKDLLIDCNQSRTLELIYKKPTCKNAEHKEIVAQKLDVQNDKLYLLGYDIEKNESATLNLKRIEEILSRKIQKANIEPKLVKVKYRLNRFDLSNIKEDERVCEYLNKAYIMEGSYFNEFTAVQRMLSFGPDCTVLEPAEIRNAVISKLKEMREVYVR